MNELDNILKQLEQQRAAIDKALEALRGLSQGQASVVKKGRGRPKRTAPAEKKRVVTAEGRQRQIEAMRKYWAAKRAAEGK